MPKIPQLPIARLKKLVAVDSNGCWIWQGVTTPKGYGLFTWRAYGRRTWSAHTAAWTLVRGPVPDGLELDHLCRVRRCVNPDHLEPVTHAENVRRAAEALRSARGGRCVRGHNVAEVGVYTTRSGRRVCQECRREHRRTHRARHVLGAVALAVLTVAGVLTVSADGAAQPAGAVGIASVARPDAPVVDGGIRWQVDASRARVREQSLRAERARAEAAAHAAAMRWLGALLAWLDAVALARDDAAASRGDCYALERLFVRADGAANAYWWMGIVDHESSNLWSDCRPSVRQFSGGPGAGYTQQTLYGADGTTAYWRGLYGHAVHGPALWAPGEGGSSSARGARFVGSGTACHWSEWASSAWCHVQASVVARHDSGWSPWTGAYGHRPPPR